MAITKLHVFRGLDLEVIRKFIDGVQVGPGIDVGDRFDHVLFSATSRDLNQIVNAFQSVTHHVTYNIHRVTNWAAVLC